MKTSEVYNCITKSWIYNLESGMFVVLLIYWQSSFKNGWNKTANVCNNHSFQYINFYNVCIVLICWITAWLLQPVGVEYRSRNIHGFRHNGFMRMANVEKLLFTLAEFRFYQYPLYGSTFTRLEEAFYS